MTFFVRTALLACCLGVSLQASIQTYGFSCITNNSGNCGLNLPPQLFVDVIGGSTTSAVVGGTSVPTIGANQVLFRFRNIGPNASSITDVYFDDGTLLNIASIINGTGVEYEAGANPGNLPGGNAVNFNTSAGFSADSNNPVQPNGVNPSEALGVLFNLQGTQTYASVINSLNLSLAQPGVDVTGGLRIGIHVQGLSGGQSEALVNTGCVNCNNDVVPEPSFYGLMAVGMTGLFVAASKMRRKAVADPESNG
ncbi:MAG: hypothetical protein JNM66_00995 [Bryobacterales bacterium]|nr:hypothetical protein [Bryobacterales bacterium]